LGNSFYIENGVRRYIVLINGSVPRINEKGEVLSDAYLLDVDNADRVCGVKAPFVYLMSEYKKSNVLPNEYLLDLLKEEASRIINDDLSAPFEEILRLTKE